MLPGRGTRVSQALSQPTWPAALAPHYYSVSSSDRDNKAHPCFSEGHMLFFSCLECMVTPLALGLCSNVTSSGSCSTSSSLTESLSWFSLLH